MTFSVTILGSNSAVPAHGRHPSAQVVQVGNHVFLVDCGEGTQMRFAANQIKWNRIDQIFISHLHGDHYFGLIGLISTYQLLRRSKPLDIYSPPGLEPIIRIQLDAGQTVMHFPLRFHEIDSTAHQVIFENKSIEVMSLPLNHRIACCGFLFREKEGDYKLDKEKLAALSIPAHLLPQLKVGREVQHPHTGAWIKTEDVCLPRKPRRSYAYCSDTTFYEPLIEQLKGVQLLYHDCTFDKAGTQRALETYHGTTEQAARLAHLAGAEKLLIGHFSAKYEDLGPLLLESREIFPHTELALEGLVFEI